MPAIFASVVDEISASMSVRSLQNAVIASNIANRDAQAYQRLKLRFVRMLEEGGTPEIVADQSPGPVSLEQDLIALTGNAAQYQVMARALNRYFLMLNAIATDTRG